MNTIQQAKIRDVGQTTGVQGLAGEQLSAQTLEAIFNSPNLEQVAGSLSAKAMSGVMALLLQQLGGSQQELETAKQDLDRLQGAHLKGNPVAAQALLDTLRDGMDLRRKDEHASLDHAWAGDCQAVLKSVSELYPEGSPVHAIAKRGMREIKFEATYHTRVRVGVAVELLRKLLALDPAEQRDPKHIAQLIEQSIELPYLEDDPSDLDAADRFRLCEEFIGALHAAHELLEPGHPVRELIDKGMPRDKHTAADYRTIRRLVVQSMALLQV